MADDALPPDVLERVNFDLLTTGPIAISLTGLLAMGFLAEITRFRYWRNNLFLQLLLKIAKSPIAHWIGQFQAFVLNVPYYNELYLVWGVLLVAGFSSFYSIIEHTIYTTNKKQLMPVNEGVLLVNNFGMCALLLYYSLWYTKVGLWYDHAIGSAAPASSPSEPWAGRGNFTIALWGICCISIIKNLYQIFSYYFADRSYGSANTKWVSFYMKRSENIQNFNPENMTGYRYVLLETKPPKAGSPPNYEIDIKDEDLVTIEHVWRSEGRLLKSSGDLGNKLKDLCLSFALFKMLKRRFVEGCETAEANRKETQDFIRHGLLESSPERVLRVINNELRFLQDLFYTKYPTVLGFGFPVYTLLFGILFACFLGIFLKLHPYNPPTWDLQHTINNDSINLDLIVTICILSTVMIIEVYEFTRYFFSNWSKVLLICKYVKSQILDHLLINKLLWVFFSIYMPGKTCYQIGQYSLLECCSFHCRAKLKFLQYRGGAKKVKYVSSKKEKIMEAILPTLKEFLDTRFSNPDTRFSNPAKITALSRPGIEGELPPWVCELHNPIQMILIWHVATNFCWMAQNKAKRKWFVKIKEPVALNISNYCAYLVAYAPELLPINTYECTLMFERIIEETCSFFSKISKKGMVGKMEKVGDNDQSVIGRGAQLGKTLKNVFKENKEMWNFLEDVWVELLLLLAPSETSVEHALKLTEGGEFITYLWVLLYHAGLLQSSFKDSTPSIV
ncbi:uncharacterized protein LOC144546046 [Carex rostrata]